MVDTIHNERFYWSELTTPISQLAKAETLGFGARLVLRALSLTSSRWCTSDHRQRTENHCHCKGMIQSQRRTLQRDHSPQTGMERWPQMGSIAARKVWHQGMRKLAGRTRSFGDCKSELWHYTARGRLTGQLEHQVGYGEQIR